MDWNTRIPGLVAFRRCVAFLILALLVLSGLAKPAIPDLVDRTSPVSDVVLSDKDQRADPVTQPSAWPSPLNNTALAVLVRTLGEPQRGVPPIKKSLPLTAIAGQVLAPAMPWLFIPGVDRPSSLEVSAVGSARTPTGPPPKIA